MSNGVRTLVTLLGMVTLARLVQLSKAKDSMLVTLLGMVMPVRPMQLLKAFFGIVVNALPERLRLIYLLLSTKAALILGNIVSSAFIVTFIGLSGLFLGWLLIYFFKSSTLLKLLPPLCPEQAAIENPITATSAIILNTLKKLFIENSFRHLCHGIYADVTPAAIAG